MYVGYKWIMLIQYCIQAQFRGGPVGTGPPCPFNVGSAAPLGSFSQEKLGLVCVYITIMSLPYVLLYLYRHLK